jgi:hypothetical protein
MRKRCPVAYSQQFGGFWALFRHHDISAATRDTESFISTPTYSWPKLDTGTPWIPLQSDPPMHRQYRRVIAPFFRGDRLRGFEPRLRELTNELLDSFARSREIDLARELSFPLPAKAICLLLGLPVANGSYFVKWTTDIINRGAAGDFTGMATVYDEVSAFVNTWIEMRRAQPGEDLMDAMLNASIEKRPMTEREIHGMFTLMFGAGHETTANAISASILFLSQHPDLRAHLVRHPEHLTQATEEFIRWSAPVRCLARTTARPITVGGRKIPEGVPVVLMWGSGSRDETMFPNPDDFSLDRSNVRKHLSFGDGIHRCIGEELARLEIRIVLEEFLARYSDFELIGDFEKSTWPTNGFHSLPMRLGRP